MPNNYVATVPSITFPKSNPTAMYPVHASSTSGLLKRCEPLLTPNEFKDRFLKGVLERLPKGVEYSNSDLKNRINRAINQIEIDLNVMVMPEQFTERLQFDWNLYKAWIKLKASNGPIVQLDNLAIVASDNTTVFQIPASWIDTGNFARKDIQVIPLLASYGASLIQGTQAGGLAFLAILSSSVTFIPAYWQITYTAGLSYTAGQMPVMMNELIGTYAAQMILSEIAANNVNTSISLSSDGLSQGSSSPGPQIYVQRIADLEEKKKNLIGSLRRITGNRMFLSTM